MQIRHQGRSLCALVSHQGNIAHLLGTELVCYRQSLVAVQSLLAVVGVVLWADSAQNTLHEAFGFADGSQAVNCIILICCEFGQAVFLQLTVFTNQADAIVGGEGHSKTIKEPINI